MGRANSSAQTSEAKGFPGRASTAIEPIAPMARGLPGLSANDSLAHAPPASRTDATMWSASASGDPARADGEQIVAAVRDAGGACAKLSLALKPGKPLAIGAIGSMAVLALPGNPFASLVGALLFARPMLQSLAGSYQGPRPPVAPNRGLRSPTERAGWSLSRSGSKRATSAAFPCWRSSVAAARRASGRSSSPTGWRAFRPRSAICRRDLGSTTTPSTRRAVFELTRS